MFTHYPRSFVVFMAKCGMYNLVSTWDGYQTQPLKKHGFQPFVAGYYKNKWGRANAQHAASFNQNAEVETR